MPMTALRAYSYAAPVIKQLFPVARHLHGDGEAGLPAGLPPESFSFGEVTDDMGRPAQEVTIVDANGQAWTAIYSFERQADGTWKISGCRLVRVPGADV